MIAFFIRFLCFLPFVLSATEIDLAEYESSFYSQNGEDGVLAKIFEVIKPTSRFCVEFGAYNGVTGSNTYLLRRQGWDALLLDRMFENPQMHLYKEFITAENINALFERYGVPEDFDLLSIDIDYNDFYVWKSLDAKYRPSVVVIEYNASHPPDKDRIVKYKPYYCGDGTNYYGASILALYRLGRKKGYSLVYADEKGVNLFFIRDDLLKTCNVTFKNTNHVEKIYRPPHYGTGSDGGHPQDPKQRPYVCSTDFE